MKQALQGCISWSHVEHDRSLGEPCHGDVRSLSCMLCRRSGYERSRA